MGRRVGQKGYWKRTRKHRKRVGNDKERLRAQRAKEKLAR